MRRLIVLFVPLLCAALPDAARAQLPVPHFEVGGAISHWRLDHGTASVAATTRTGGSFSLGVFPGATGAQVGVHLLASYAPEGELEPGILSGLAELEMGFGAPRSEGARLAVILGAGALRFATERQDRAIEWCRPELGCMYEGISYRGGWRTILSGGMKGDLPIGRSFAVQPQVRVVLHRKDGAEWMDARTQVIRTDLGVVWRR